MAHFKENISFKPKTVFIITCHFIPNLDIITDHGLGVKVGVIFIYYGQVSQTSPLIPVVVNICLIRVS